MQASLVEAESQLEERAAEIDTLKAQVAALEAESDKVKESVGSFEVVVLP